MRLETGATILIEYNIDLAPRINPLAVGDSIIGTGEYLWWRKGRPDALGSAGIPPERRAGAGYAVRGKVYQ